MMCYGTQGHYPDEEVDLRCEYEEENYRYFHRDYTYDEDLDDWDDEDDCDDEISGEYAA